MISRSLKLLLIALVASLALCCVVEAIQLIFVYRTVSKISYFGIRFVVTGEVYEEVCNQEFIYAEATKHLREDFGLTSVIINEDSVIREIEISTSTLLALDLEDEMQDCDIYDPDRTFESQEERYQISAAMTDVARYYSTLQAMEYAYNSWIDPDQIQTTICSTRPGFKYSPSSHTCEPRQDPGRFNSEDRVVVYVRYHYSFGSSLGLSFWKMPINSERWGLVEQWRLK